MKTASSSMQFAKVNVELELQAFKEDNVRYVKPALSFIIRVNRIDFKKGYAFSILKIN